MLVVFEQENRSESAVGGFAGGRDCAVGVNLLLLCTVPTPWLVPLVAVGAGMG